LPLAACLYGFDEHKLRAPSADAGSGAPGVPTDGLDGGSSDGAVAPADQGGTLGPMCINFSALPAGKPLPQWIEGHGMWRTVAMGQATALGQLDTPTYRHERFLAWQGMNSANDVAVRATIVAMDSSDNCVMARVTDANNYYLLCVRDDNGGQQGANWDLGVIVGGTENRLAGSNLGASAASHTLVLSVKGTTITATIDGMVQPSVTDNSLGSGAAGVATESSGAFSNFCVTPM